MAMRLLFRSENGRFQLKEFEQGDIPPYAILSHTWGPKEVTYKDINKGRIDDGDGCEKIKFCLDKALADGLQYCWLDTCCINKEDSRELQFSLNSMFKFYKQAAVCYAYLSDVPSVTFDQSRWFRRGWTLQELIAPDTVKFFDSEGLWLGEKKSMVKGIEKITGVPPPALLGSDLFGFSFHQILEWTKSRETKYGEDMAYSLLGLFGVTMIPNYGEGRDKAFSRLRKEVLGTPHRTEQCEMWPTPPSNIPYKRDPKFVDRKLLTGQMSNKLSGPAARVALVGLGGVGKSQLAIEHCYRTKERSPETWVLWMHASNAARYEQSVRDIADLVKIPGRDDPNANIYTLFRDWLRDTENRKWMIVLDNADDVGFLQRHDSGPSLLQCLPVSSQGKLLITTRDRDTARKLVSSEDLIVVNPMDGEHAITLLESRLELPTSLARSAELVATLEYMPLAITQAAAYINKMGRRCSVQQYMDKIQKSNQSKRSILDKDEGDIRRDSEAKNAIMLTWQISFEHIRKSRPTAADLLSLMSRCDRSAIPTSLLRAHEKRRSQDARPEQGKNVTSTGEKSYGAESTADSNDDLNELSDSSDTGSLTSLDERFADDISTLESYSFVSTTVDVSVFEMHRLVQLAMGKWLKAEGQQEFWKERFVYNLDMIYPHESYEDWNMCQILYPQVAAAMVLKMTDPAACLHQAQILHRAGRYARKKGSLSQSESIIKRSMKVYTDCLGKDDPNTLLSMGNLASTYRSQRRSEEAGQLEIKVLEASKQILGESHPDTLVSMGNLASIYREQGRLGEAEQLEIKVLEASKQVLGESHPDTLVSMGNLASIYREQGRLGEAEQLEIKALEARKQVLGESHPGTLLSIGRLASIYRKQGRLDEAEQLEIKVLEASKQVLGESHPGTLVSMGNLASIYREQGRLGEAEQLEIKVLEARKQVLGESHPDTLVSMGSLASIYRKQGRLGEAEQLQIKALEARKQVLGESHPRTLLSMGSLASIYRKQGRLGEAEQLQIKALEASKQILGESHPDTLVSMGNLASIYRRQGCAEEAQGIEARLAQARKESPRPNS